MPINSFKRKYTSTTLLGLTFLLLFSCKTKEKETIENVEEVSSIMSYEEATKSLSQAEKVGQFFMPAAYINDTEEGIQSIEKLITEQNVGALCFFHSRISTAANFGSKKQVVINDESLAQLKEMIARYQKIAKYPLLIAIDAEWGLAMRVENTPQYPYAITLGAMQNQDKLIHEVGKNVAIDLQDAGIHWNLGPVVDVNNNPNNPVIGFRSFGENPELVAKNGIAYNQGVQSQGILTSAKHFPGHGDTATDSHLGLPVINKSKEELFETEIYPFKELIKADVDAVMIGHLSVPALANGNKEPATISKEIIQNVLRKELKFENVIISDALNMKSVSKMFPVKGELEWVAFDAGNDFLCFAENTIEGTSTILKNASTEQIERSFKRVWNLKRKAYLTHTNSEKQAYSYRELNSKIAEESLTLYKGTEENITAVQQNDFALMSLSKDTENKFSESISIASAGHYSTADMTIPNIRKAVKNDENILIALFPPQVRTRNNFGISDEELALINEMASTKNVTLYLFGNPFVLNLLDTEKMKNIVLVYQDSNEFQEHATQHFLGKTKAKGKLPVTL
jgi:beta-glucosidase-like glycosyl hydrolase